MLFNAKSREDILNGKKTQTRRCRRSGVAVPGALHWAQTKLFDKSTRFARLRILNVWEWDGNTITPEDVKAEGYNTKSEFLNAYRSMNHNRIGKPGYTHYAIEFEVVSYETTQE